MGKHGAKKSNGDTGYHQPIYIRADQQHEETPRCQICPRFDRPRRQSTSYEAQVDYYTNYIKGRDDWEFVAIYTEMKIA